MGQVVRRGRNESVNERIRISPKLARNGSLWYRAAAHVFDDQDVAHVIRMDAFVAPTAEAAIKRSQTGAAAGVWIKIGAHLDDTADRTVFLGKKQCATKRIPGRTIDAVESSQTIRVAWCHQRDAMIGMRHIKIDSREIGAIGISVWHFMSLKKEMPAIIVARRGATRIMIQNEISIFIRLGTTAIA